MNIPWFYTTRTMTTETADIKITWSVILIRII